MTDFPFTLAQRLRAGETVLTVWSSIPENNLVDYLASTPFEAVTLDMQHGGHHEASIYDGVAAVVRRGKSAVVRIPVSRNDFASRALDFGADAVISPMINSVDDAVQFVDAVKYPPMGQRSWGASRAISVRGIAGGNAQLHGANDQTLSFAMIETMQAYAALDDILEVPGIDAVFVGPADFSIAFTEGAQINASLEDMMETVADIAAKAKSAGKLAGIFSMDPKLAPRFKAMGYQFIAVGFDTSFISKGAEMFYQAASDMAADDELDGGY